MKSWFVRAYEESGYYFTKCDGKVEKDAFFLDEEKGVITYVDEGYDAEHIPSVLKHSLEDHP